MSQLYKSQGSWSAVNLSEQASVFATIISNCQINPYKFYFSFSAVKGFCFPALSTYNLSHLVSS